MNIPYKIVGVLAVIAVTAYFGYQAGADSIRADLADALAKAGELENKKVNEVIKWKEKEKVVYRDRIQKIKVAADPTGCLDTDLRDVGLDGMLRSDNR